MVRHCIHIKTHSDLYTRPLYTQLLLVFVLLKISGRETLGCTTPVLFPHLGLSLEAQAASVGLVVKLVVGVHDPAQVDAADLLCAALGFHVVEQPVNDATNVSLIFQIVNIFCRKEKKVMQHFFSSILTPKMIILTI